MLLFLFSCILGLLYVSAPSSLVEVVVLLVFTDAPLNRITGLKLAVRLRSVKRLIRGFIYTCTSCVLSRRVAGSRHCAAR